MDVPRFNTNVELISGRPKKQKSLRALLRGNFRHQRGAAFKLQKQSMYITWGEALCRALIISEEKSTGDYINSRKSLGLGRSLAPPRPEVPLRLAPPIPRHPGLIERVFTQFKKMVCMDHSVYGDGLTNELLVLRTTECLPGSLDQFRSFLSS
jgi:hypothetical protein